MEVEFEPRGFAGHPKKEWNPGRSTGQKQASLEKIRGSKQGEESKNRGLTLLRP